MNLIEKEMAELRENAIRKMETYVCAYTTFEAHGFTWCVVCGRSVRPLISICCGYETWVPHNTIKLESLVASIRLEEALGEI